MNRELVQNAVENVVNRTLIYIKNETRNIIDGEETCAMIDYNRVVSHLDAMTDEITSMFCGPKPKPNTEKEPT